MDTSASHFVKSLARGLAVIKIFGDEKSDLALTEVAERADMSRAAARRFLLTLADLGYVRTDGHLFALTPRVLELGYSYLSSHSLPKLSQPHLERLASTVHESSSVSVLDDMDVVYVARAEVSRIMRVAITVGTRFPAHCTSMGRVLLSGLRPVELDAFLEQTALDPHTSHTVTSVGELRKQIEHAGSDGWAIVDQELEEGLRSIAAPIHDEHGEVIAAINLSCSANRTSIDVMRDQLLPPLLDTASAIGDEVRLTNGRPRAVHATLSPDRSLT